MIGFARNLTGLLESRDVSRLVLARDYARLRAQRAAGRSPDTVRIAGQRVAYRDLGAVVEAVEEIFLRRQYRFGPRRPTPYVIDCGANIGLATLYFKTIAPAARIVAFEPEPTAFELLQANVDRNDLHDVTCVNAAVARVPGTAVLRTSAAASRGASFHLPQPDGCVDVEVPTVCVSDYVNEEVDFLKLDVEGSELDVIEDLADSGRLRLVREMGIEFHPGVPEALPRLLSIFVESGFTYAIAEDTGLLWDPSQLLLIHARQG